MYPNGTEFSMRQGTVLTRARTWQKGVPVWLAGVVAVLLLVAAGTAYRVMASGIRTILDAPVELPVPLNAVPSNIGNWAGKELDIPTVTRAYMKANFADDYISRRYVNKEEGLWADVYVVYCSSHPGGILGHQPLVCFPAHGWAHDQTVQSEIVSRSGRAVRCLIHRFHKPSPAFQQEVVLSFYVVNGQITLTERDFSTFLGRKPNMSGDPARYIAQVQISSTVEHSARAAASEMVDLILSLLPDEDGRVRAADLPDRSIRTAPGAAANSQ